MTATATPDLEAVKAKQRVNWTAGDYAVIGTTLQLVGESLCEAVDLGAGERVLDVAAGNGNVALAAARRGCDVTAVDYVPALLDGLRCRAEAEGAAVDARVGDAEALDVADGAYDVVLSSFGVMFTANQERAAAELLRACRSGGRIGLANWTPTGFIGQLFKTMGTHVPPPAGVRPPMEWGTEARLAELLGDGVSAMSVTERSFVFRYRSAEHFVDVFRTCYGPMAKAFETLDAAGGATLAADLVALAAAHDVSADGTLRIPSTYVEVVAVRR